MKLHLDQQTTINLIKRYEPGAISIGEITYSSSIVVTTEEIRENWRPQAFDDLIEQDFESLLTLKPELIILGTGKQQRFPETHLYESLIHNHIGLEIMDTAAACRTYNILAAEGRRVAAGLINSK